MHIRNLTLVVAMDARGVIGRGDTMPWGDIKDAKWFREKTMHRSLIMGRRTFDSIVVRNGQPLEKRASIVLSRRPWDEAWPSPGVDDRGVRWARDPLEALDMAGWGWNGSGTSDAVVIGGAEVYAIFLPFARTISLTHVTGEHEGDVTFPGGYPGSPEWRDEAGPLHGDGFSCHTLVRGR